MQPSVTPPPNKTTRTTTKPNGESLSFLGTPTFRWHSLHKTQVFPTIFFFGVGGVHPMVQKKIRYVVTSENRGTSVPVLAAGV